MAISGVGLREKTGENAQAWYDPAYGPPRGQGGVGPLAAAVIGLFTLDLADAWPTHDTAARLVIIASAVVLFGAIGGGLATRLSACDSSRLEPLPRDGSARTMEDEVCQDPTGRTLPDGSDGKPRSGAAGKAEFRATVEQWTWRLNSYVPYEPPSTHMI